MLFTAKQYLPFLTERFLHLFLGAMDVHGANMEKNNEPGLSVKLVIAILADFYFEVVFSSREGAFSS